MANYFGNSEARKKLSKSGGTANKKKGTNMLKKTGSKSAYAKLKSAGTKAGAILALKKAGGGAAKSTSKMNPKAKRKPSTKAMAEYNRKMKAGQRKSNLQRKSR
jgi:hypothetical protein